MSKQQFVLTNVIVVRGGICGTSPEYVQIQGNRIAETGLMKNYRPKAEYEEHNLSGCFVLPGLIDAHVHLVGGRSEMVYGETGVLAEPKLVRAMRSVYEAQKLLKRGITSVRDISLHGLYLKRIFGEGLMPGPRIVACGLGLNRTGGHADIPQFPTEFVRSNPCWGVLADGEDEIRRAVRENLREGADQIKVFACGGGNWDTDRMSDIHYTQHELDVCCEEAHMIEGTLVCSHAETTESIRMSIKAGVDTIEHGEGVTEEIAQSMQKKGVILVPTINLIANWYRDFMPPGGITPDRPDAFLHRTKDLSFDEDEVEADRKAVIKSFNTARKNGVKIALGSDTVYEPLTEYGEYSLLEYLSMIELGMSVPEAIRSATEIGAEALGMGDFLGKVEPDYLADLLVLEKDPTADPKTLYDATNIRYIISDGRFAMERGKMMF